jgi:hypothetical protein
LGPRAREEEAFAVTATNFDQEGQVSATGKKIVESKEQGIAVKKRYHHMKKVIMKP